MRLKLIIPIILLTGFMSFAQSNNDATQNTDFQSYFSIKAGVNAVDSAGDQSPFDSFSDAEEMAFTSPFAVGIDYRFSRLLSVGLFGSVNKWVAADGDIIDRYVVTEDVDYFSIDLNLKFYVDELLFFKNSTKRDWLDIYVSAGGGYFTEIGSGLSANLGLGGNLWITNKFGVSLEGMAKFSEEQHTSSNHFQYFAGITYRFVGNDKDSDNDGIRDSKDDCPNVPGVKDNNGCPKEDDAETKVEEVKPQEPTIINMDSDNDGVTDAYDNCPNVPGNIENRGCPGMPKFMTEAAKPTVVTIPKDVSNQLWELSKTVRFDTDEGDYNVESTPILDQIVEILQQYPGATINLVGHTDATASPLYNQGLSMVRANKVRDYLVNNGLSGYVITIDGKGETEPTASNLSVEGRRKNRRVELKAGATN